LYIKIISVEEEVEPWSGAALSLEPQPMATYFYFYLQASGMAQCIWTRAS
jgi:hypothetical protein